MLAAILLALSAAAADHPCRPLGTTGCVYSAPEALQAPMPALMVYFRGWWGSYQGSVPDSKRVASAQQAFDGYGLRKVADEQGITIVVTGSSDAAFAGWQLQELEAALQTRFKRLHLASHSGGYVGLWNSMTTLPRPDRFLMLDNFYFPDGLSKLVGDKVKNGSECAGFYTAHNKKRHDQVFKPHAQCSVEARDDFGHDGAVNKCLPKFLAGEACK